MNWKILLYFSLCGPFILLQSCEFTHAPSSEYEFNGKVYPLIPESDASLQKKDSLLRIAMEKWETDPSELENWIWYGRRVAYTFDYPKAIDIFSQGLEKFPDSPQLYRHRGHRYISIRDFDSAIQDLNRAAELAKEWPVTIEQDGIPNKLNIPLSNLQFNIWYHLGLAYYLKGDFSNARQAYTECISVSNNPDLMVATVDWMYMTCMRLDDTLTANSVLKLVRDDFEIIENDSYFKRIKMYKGQVQADELLDLENTSENAQLDIVTQGYGVGNYYLCQRDSLKAKDIFTKVVSCDYWPAFGYIAAEADLGYLQGINNPTSE